MCAAKIANVSCRLRVKVRRAYTEQNYAGLAKQLAGAKAGIAKRDEDLPFLQMRDSALRMPEHTNSPNRDQNLMTASE